MSIAKEIIYESPDIETEIDLQLPEEQDDNDIERIHLDIDNVKHFAGKYITVDGVDFSKDNGRKGYKTGAYILEVVGHDFPEPETIEQKYNRLQMEILDLKSQIDNSEKQEKPDIVVTKNHITELSKQLEQILLKKAASSNNENRDELEKNKTSYSFLKTTLPKMNIDAMVITDFEARLNRLEKALGSVDMVTGSTVQISGSLAQTIDDLKTRVDCLNPSLLEATENRLNKVLAKQNEEDKDVDAQFIETVDSVYKIISNYQNSHDIINNVCTRLKALASLHEQAADFSLKLNEIYASKKQITEGIETNKQMIQEFNELFKETVQNLKKEIETSKSP